MKMPIQIEKKTPFTANTGELGVRVAPESVWYPRESPTKQHDDVLTASEVAELLRCSKSHVYKLLNGTIPGLQVLPHLALGRKKVIPRSSFEHWKRCNIIGIIQPNSEMNAVDVVQ